MFHLGAFYEDINPGGVLVPIAAVREEMFFTIGDDYRVPEAYPFIIGGAALIEDASAARGQIVSPSLRILANLDVEPVIAAAVFGSPPEVLFHGGAPIPLTPDEALNFYMESAPVAVEVHYGLVWLADGPQQAVSGQMFSVRATATVAQAVDAWTNGDLAFGQTLPAGRYQVIGMRARSTDGVAARLVFPEQVARPGVACVNAVGDIDPTAFRFCRSGVFVEFPDTNPPTVDVLGGVAAAQIFIFDLLRVG